MLTFSLEIDENTILEDSRGTELLFVNFYPF